MTKQEALDYIPDLLGAINNNWYQINCGVSIAATNGPGFIVRTTADETDPTQLPVLGSPISTTIQLAEDAQWRDVTLQVEEGYFINLGSMPLPQVDDQMALAAVEQQLRMAITMQFDHLSP